MAYVLALSKTLAFGGAVVTAPNGYIYAFGATADHIAPYKSTNGGTSFTDLTTVTSTTIHGAASQIGHISAAVDGDGNIHVVSAANADATRDISYGIFNTNTETWGTWEQVAAYNKVPTTFSASISIDSSKKPHILFIQAIANMGTNYDRIYYTNKTGASWLTPEMVSTGTTTNYKTPDIMVRNSDVVEAMYATNRPIYRTRTSGSWGTETVWTNAVTVDENSLISDTSGNVYRYSTNNALYENDVRVGTVFSTHAEVAFINGTRNVIYSGSSDDGHYLYNNGSGWGAETDIEPSPTFRRVIIEWAYNYEYQSGRINYIFDNTTNLYFNYVNLAPTTTLGIPDEDQQLTDATPELKFTGTDPQADAVDYEVQVFVSSDGYDDSQLPAAANTYTTLYASYYNGVGQSFTSLGGVLRSCQFHLKRAGSPTGNVYAKLYSHSGTYGTSSVPDTLLATSDAIDITTIPGIAGLVTFKFSGTNQVSLTAGTYYVITVEFSGGAGIDNLLVYDANSETHSGNRSRKAGTWSSSANDLAFTVSAPLIDAFSTDHTGFSAGASHPTASGTEQTYTIQSDLSDGAYYWRVRATDPSGSAAWGAWSSIKHFDLAAGGGPLAPQSASHTHSTDIPTLTAHVPTFTLTVENASHTHQVDNVSVTAHEPAVSLSPNPAEHTHVSDNCTLTAHIPTFTLVVQSAGHTHVANSPSFTQHQILTSDSAVHTHSAIVPGLVIDLTVDAAQHIHQANAPNLVQHHVLVPSSATNAHLADNVTVTGHIPTYQLVVDNATHSHSADNVTVTAHVPGSAIEPQSASHTHSTLTPDLTQHHIATPQSASHVQNAGEPSFIQHHRLAPDNASNSHLAGTLGLIVNLSVLETTHAQSADYPALVQHHVLAADQAVSTHGANNVTLRIDLQPQAVSHTQTADSPNLTQHHVLVSANAESAHFTESPNLTQHQVLASDSAVHAHGADQPSVSVAGSLAPEIAQHTHGAAEPLLTQHHVLAVSAGANTHSADNLALVVNLAVQNASHAQSAGSPLLTQHHQLEIQNATDSHTADGASLTQHHRIAVQEASHAQASDNTGLTQHHVLSVFSAANSHGADSPALIQHHVAVPQSASSSHAADSPTLVLNQNPLAPDAVSHAHSADNLDGMLQHHMLEVQGAGQAHYADHPSLSVSGSIVPDAASHTHASASPNLTQHHVLVVDGVSHAHQADSITSGINLVVNGAQHSHGADVPNLIQHQVIVAQGASHSHGALAPTFTQHHVLAPSTAVHTHLANQVGFSQNQVLEPEGAIHTHGTDGVKLVVHAVPQVAQHSHVADSPTIVGHQSSGVQDATHTQSADEPALVQHQVLAPENATSAHGTDSPAVAILQPVDDARHTQIADSPELSSYLPPWLTGWAATHIQTADEPTLAIHFPGEVELGERQDQQALLLEIRDEVELGEEGSFSEEARIPWDDFEVAIMDSSSGLAELSETKEQTVQLTDEEYT